MKTFKFIVKAKIFYSYKKREKFMDTDNSVAIAGGKGMERGGGGKGGINDEGRRLDLGW